MTPDLTAPVDDLHLDCVAALAIIRNQFAAAARRVDSRWRQFATDCQQLARRVEETAT